MNPGKRHEKVEQLKSTREKALSQLHYVDERGRQQPRYAPELQSKKTREIEEAFDADLRALMEQAQGLYDEAEAKLARVDRPYGWLTPDELTTAAAMAPFVKEDISRMDAGSVLSTVQSAIDANRVERWLIDRYARQRWQELDQTIETSPGMGAKAHFDKSAAELQSSIIPEKRLKERDEAKQQLADAQTLHDAAEWARPAVRQAAADRWKVDVNYLPD